MQHDWQIERMEAGAKIIIYLGGGNAQQRMIRATGYGCFAFAEQMDGYHRIVGYIDSNWPDRAVDGEGLIWMCRHFTLSGGVLPACWSIGDAKVNFRVAGSVIGRLHASPMQT